MSDPPWVALKIMLSLLKVYKTSDLDKPKQKSDRFDLKRALKNY